VGLPPRELAAPRATIEVSARSEPALGPGMKVPGSTTQVSGSGPGKDVPTFVPTSPSVATKPGASVTCVARVPRNVYVSLLKIHSFCRPSESARAIPKPARPVMSVVSGISITPGISAAVQ
jgi:hypothetical protein